MQMSMNYASSEAATCVTHTVYMRRKLPLSYRNSVLWITCEKALALLARVFANFAPSSQVEEGYLPHPTESMDMTFDFNKTFHCFHNAFTAHQKPGLATPSPTTQASTYSSA